MHPAFGIPLFVVTCGVVWIVASKRGRAGSLFFIGSVVGGVLLAMLVSAATSGNGIAAGFGAFLAPIAALVIVLASRDSRDLAVAQGEHGDFRKCPFCAEAIRREAIKCRFCGSTLAE